MINFVKLGALVATVFLVSFGPFVILVRYSNYYKGSATLSCRKFKMFKSKILLILVFQYINMSMYKVIYL